MAFPSKAQFESFENAAKWIPKQEWIDAARNEILPTNLRDFLLAVYSAKLDSYKKIIKHPVYKWFSLDQNARAAFRSFRYKLGVFPSEDEIGALIEILIPTMTKHPHCIYRDVIQNRLVAEITGIARAFYDYQYTDRWKIIVSTGRDFSALVSDAMKKINAVEQQIGRLGPVVEFYTFSSIDPLQSMLKNIERIKYRLNHFFYCGKPMLPSRRLDEKAREWILVFDLAKVLRRSSGRDKPTAIANFLRVEGIHNPVDQRTIERLLSDWKEARKVARSTQAKALDDLRHLSML